MLKSVKIFLKTVELGSFSQTAKVLNVAPSSIARAIDGLEADLQVSLFKRSTRKLVLTDKGQQFLEGADKLLSNLDAIREGLSDNQQEPAGHLRLSVFESYGRVVVCPLLPAFLQKYPKVTVEIELENKICDLAAENIDIAIRVGTPMDSNLKSRKLSSVKTTLCAAPDYIANHPKLTQPSDLQAHNCLTFNRGRQATHWHFTREKQYEKILVNGNLKSRGGTALHDAALKGLGIVQLSNWMVAENLENGLLVACLDEWQASLAQNSSGQVYLVYQATTFPNPLVRLFIDFLVKNI